MTLKGVKSTYTYVVSCIPNLFLSRLVDDVGQQLATFPLFGGDLVSAGELLNVVADALNAMIDAGDIPNQGRGLNAAEKMLSSINKLLGERLTRAWRDLPAEERTKAVSVLLEAAEAVAVDMAKMMPGQTMTTAEENICE